jgi:hypothetical protein
VRFRTILGTASSAKYQPDTNIQWFAVRLNQHYEHTSACAGGFLADKHIDGVGGSITVQTAIDTSDREIARIGKEVL